MKVLQILQKCFAVLGIKRPKTSETRLMNPKNTITAIWLGALILSTNEFLFFEAHSFKEYTASFYATWTIGLCGVNFAILIWKTAKVFNFIEDLQIVIQNRLKYPIPKEIYGRANRNVELLSKILCYVMMVISPVCVLFPLFIYSLFAYYSTDLKQEAFQLPFPGWLPFDYKTVTGYLIAFIIEYVSVLMVACASTCHTCFIVGSCWMLITLVEDIIVALRALNNRTTSKTNQTKLLSEFSELLQLHSDATQLSKKIEVSILQVNQNLKRIFSRLAGNFSEAYEFIFSLFFLWSASTLCGTLLMIQMAISSTTSEQIDQIVLMTLFGEMFWSIACIFLFCEFGDRVNNEFDELNDVIDELNWYIFPIEIQRMFPFIMIVAQKPIEIRGYGNIACSRNVFLKVINGGCSYFMVLRQFEN